MSQFEEKIHPGAEEVEPGWIYYKQNKKFFPQEGSRWVEKREGRPRYTIEILPKKTLKQIIANTKYPECYPWATEYCNIKSGDVIVIRGVKNVETVGKSIRCLPEQHVVRSVERIFSMMMLVHFSQDIPDSQLTDLKQYLESYIHDSTSYLPLDIPNCHLKYFLYYKEKKAEKKSSLKHGFEEFCRLLKDTEVSTYVHAANVLTPELGKCSRNTKPSLSKLQCEPVHNQVGNQDSAGNKMSTTKLNEHCSNEPGKLSMDDTAVNNHPLSAATMNPSQEKLHREHTAVNTHPLSAAASEPRHCSVTTSTEGNCSYAAVVKSSTSGYVHSKAATIETSNCTRPNTADELSQYGSKTSLCRTDKGSSASKAHGYDKNFSDKSRGIPEVVHQYPPSRQWEDRQRHSEATLSGTAAAPPSRQWEDPQRHSEATLSGTAAHTTITEASPGVKTAVSFMQDSEVSADEISFDAIMNSTGGVDKFPLSRTQNRERQFLSSSSVWPASTCTTRDVGKLQDNKNNAAQAGSDSAWHETRSAGITVKKQSSAEDHLPSSLSSGISNKGSQATVTNNQNQYRKQLDATTSSECCQACYLTPVEEVSVAGMVKKYYGVKPQKKELTLLLLGASGSGKTTVINFIANYFSGNKTPDENLIRVAPTYSSASITSYIFCPSEEDVPICIIDTPGLNDSSGVEVRDHVQALKTFLANFGSQNLDIHAIGFVAQAHIVRLTSSERLVMDYVSTLFGQDISDHIITLVTFADNQETPPVVEAIKNYGVNCNSFLKFNNSAFSVDIGEEIDDLDRVYWRIGNKSWKKCLKILQKLPALAVSKLKSVGVEVYSAHVTSSAERDLNTALNSYLSHLEKGSHYEAGRHSAEQVWEKAVLVTHLRGSQQTSVEQILVELVEQTCSGGGAEVSRCVKTLSLLPSRDLTVSGMSVIHSIAPLYHQATSLNKGCQKKLDPKVLYCHICQNFHKIKAARQEKQYYNYIVRSSTSYVTYCCTECKCVADVHGEHPDDTESLTSEPAQCLRLQDLLQNALDCLLKVVQKMSIPGHEVQLGEFLQHLLKECPEHRLFIRELYNKH